MGIEQVNHGLRTLDIADGYNADEYDIASMKIHHTYNPSKNYCLVELKIPSIKRQIGTENFNSILESLRMESLHGIKFIEVSNKEFYSFIEKEGKSSIDRVRKIKNGIIYTYYFSSTRKLKFMLHDYYMAMLLYTGYPKRNYIRRTPCATINQQCIKCFDYLKEPVRDFLHEGQPDNNVEFYKYFFDLIGKNHRLLMAYTVEKIKSPGECFTKDEPKYFVSDLNAKYFKNGFKEANKFEMAVINQKINSDEDIYLLSIGDGENSVTYKDYCMPTKLTKINIKNKNAPNQYLRDIFSYNFDEVWKFDFESINTRNTIHKYQYNHWATICTLANDGLWCSWDATQTISSAVGNAPGKASDKAEVESQLIQVSTMVGWGPDIDKSSTDTVYKFLFKKEDGINYEDVIEPLPKRKVSLV